jgi:hypothetical protein
VDIRSIGDPLDRIRARFDAVRLSTRALRSGEEQAIRIAERYREVLLQHIEEQDLEWPPLQEAYRQWKIDQGLDPRIWIATGELRDHIVVWKSFETHSTAGIRVGYMAGIPRSAERTTGEALFIIARALEFGVPADLMPQLTEETRRRIEEERGGWFIPPRPLFLPSARQVAREAQQGLV